MPFAASLARLLFDPRGRISRQDLLLAATVMLALDMGLAGGLQGHAFYALKALAWWVGGVGIVKRLHDVGRSGWWFAGGLAALCMWSALLGVALALTIGFESLVPGGMGYLVLLALLILPALGATLWLHLAPGEPGVNRFGAPPAGVLAALTSRPARNPEALEGR